MLKPEATASAFQGEITVGKAKSRVKSMHITVLHRLIAQAYVGPLLLVKLK